MKNLKEKENKKEPSNDTIYWDSKQNVYMQYNPFWEKFTPKRISIWDIDKPEYQPQNLQDYQTLFKQDSSKQENNKPREVTIPYRKGVMVNNYSQPVDTISLGEKSPYLNNMIDFNKSKSIPSDMWNYLTEGVNYLGKNEYGKKILNQISPKSYYFEYTPMLDVPAQIKWNKRSINYSSKTPQLNSQIEELIHAGQMEFYKRGSGNIPSMNIEFEAKVLEDIIKKINYNNEDLIIVTPKNIKDNLNNNENDINEFLYHIQHPKIFIGTDLEDEYIKGLNTKYDKMIERIAQNEYFTTEDLDIYKEVGKFMSPEKSRHDARSFDERIIPSFLINIFE